MWKINDTKSRQNFWQVLVNDYITNPEKIAADSCVRVVPAPSAKKCFRIEDLNTKIAFLDFSLQG